MQQYRDFLGREGDEAGISGWAGAVASGAWNRVQVIDAFMGSQEFGGMVAPVVRLYFATFPARARLRGPRAQRGLLRSGAITLLQLADAFAASAEFHATYGSLDDAQFVTLLYQKCSARARPGRARRLGRVAAGRLLARAGPAGFSESAEHQAARSPEVQATMMYAGMLRRTPEAGGFAAWVDFLRGGNPAVWMIDSFFGSAEYRARSCRSGRGRPEGEAGAGLDRADQAGRTFEVRADQER